MNWKMKVLWILVVISFLSIFYYKISYNFYPVVIMAILFTTWLWIAPILEETEKLLEEKK